MRKTGGEDMGYLRFGAGFVALFCFWAVSLPDSYSREHGLVHIMRLLEVENPEELDSQIVEQLSVYMEHPVRINSATAARLTESGLFTQYQAASIIDYRERNGDILSFAELACVDGFSESAAEILCPFVSLESYAQAGRSSSWKGYGTNVLTMRSSGRIKGPAMDYAYGLKYHSSPGGSVELGIACSRPYSAKDHIPRTGSFYLAGYGRKRLGKIIIGDFNLRYGQGLSLWSGFRTSGFSYPQSFSMRPSGISPCRSFNGENAFRGIAADFNAGRFTISASLASGGLYKLMYGKKGQKLTLMPAVNAGWTGRSFQISLTFCGETAELSAGMSGNPFDQALVSADFRGNIRGVNIFGEAAFEFVRSVPRALAGAALRICGDLEAGILCRYTEKEYGITAGGSFSTGKRIRLKGREGFGSSVARHSGMFSIDAVRFTVPKYGAEGESCQLKMRLDYNLQVSSSVAIAFRVSERLRTEGEANRTDIRCDTEYSSGKWMFSARFNALFCKDFAFLSYIEGGYRAGIVAVWLRAGVFRADSWQDRIYSYERDAPGNFNVPAYYGRGCWEAFTIGIRPAKWVKIHLRLSSTQYPFASGPTKRLPQSEMKLQAVFDI